MLDVEQSTVVHHAGGARPRLIEAGRLLVFLVAGTMGFAAAGQETDDASRAYGELLAQALDGRGLVDYPRLVDRRGVVDAYVDRLAAPGLLHEQQPEAQRLATLINAYNAFTLRLIIDHYDAGRLSSITDLHGGKPWDVAEWTLSGQRVSLNQIEHEHIRENFNEPRIHWALVCAAWSCPPLRHELYTAEDLDRQLADQERRVLLKGDRRFIQLEGDDETAARVTPLFEWYGQDFGNWREYSNQRRPGPRLRFVGFLDYDWRLNAQPSP